MKYSNISFIVLLLGIIINPLLSYSYSREQIVDLFYNAKNYEEVIRLITLRGDQKDDWDIKALGLAKTCLGKEKCKKLGGFMWHDDQAIFFDRYAQKGIEYNSPEERAAVALWEEAFDIGESKEAPYLLALHKYEPLKNYSKAMYLLRISAENGNVNAQTKMGTYFEEGKFVEVDLNEAIKWYTMASDNGSGSADLQIGVCNERLYRKTNDIRYVKSALKYYYKANQKGFARTVLEDSNEDGRQTYRNQNPCLELYQEGVLEARNYKSFEDWEKNVVANLAKESSVDINIPHTDKRSQSLALVIANEDYAYEQNVPYAENDGEVVSKYLKYTLGIPSDNVILIKNASLNIMKRKIEDLMDRVTPSTQQIIVYYIGHGIPATDMSTSFMLPIDGYAIE